MLALSFFILIFSSLLWIIYAVMHVLETVGAGGFRSAGIADVSVYAAYVLLPVFAVWIVFAVINQFLHDYRFNRSLNKLFIQMKKNQDYSDLIARIMLESEQQIRDGFIVQQFDLFVSDMNDLISEIIQRSSLASPEQIDRLWSKVRNGGKWSFGKVIIEVNQSQPTFQMRMFEKAGHDIVLAGTIMEFCARYQNIVELFEKHDNEKIFLNIIETGVLGKVFSIFAPVSDELKRKREASQAYAALGEGRFEQMPPVQASAPETFRAPVSENSVRPEYRAPAAPERPVFAAPAAPVITEPAVPEDDEKEEQHRPSLSGKFSLGKKFALFGKKKNREDEEYIDYRRPEESSRDPFSMALERSFGDDAPVTPPAEPSFEISAPQPETPTVFAQEKTEEKVVVEDDVIPILNNTQRTLESLRREWEQMSSSAARTEEPHRSEPSLKAPAAGEEAFSSPFRGWVDEENYK
ncbi:MAG: hypothetical protein IJ479_00100 [Alphaproteobacteria bacterium]|nr:hypothetical protein [Alphaproteobacteria bacterium]